MKAWRAHIQRFGGAGFPGEPWARILLGLLLVLAGVLRSWDLFSIPYTHDEISALVRIYPSLYETVKRGVVQLDTHPPGVQVFEWFWTRLFGMDEAVVKLPFIVMSLASIFLLYRMTIRWTSASVALLLTALMATLQYSVMYGQIARPYAAGLFTTALLADQLTAYIARGGRRHLRGALVGAVLSAYAHHFSMMLAVFMVVGAFFLIRPEQRKAYYFMCGLGILLYLPNLSIFAKQLGHGGLTEWLSPPDRYWLGDYAMYIAHWSFPFALLLGAIVIASLVIWVRRHMRHGPALPLFLFWGTAPLVIGLLYSVLHAPVIQFSMLLFSFPYLVIVLFMGLRDIPRNAAIPLVIVVSAVSVFTLIHTRKHYEIFYRSKYDAIIEHGVQAVHEHGTEGVAVLVDAPDETIRFLMEQRGITTDDLPYVQLRNTLSAGHIHQRLRSFAGRRIIYGQTNNAAPENLARIQYHFPHLIQRMDLADGEIYEFSDRKQDKELHIEDRRKIAWASPAIITGPWEVASDLPLIKEEGSPDAWDLNGREFGISLGMRTDTVVNHHQDQFEMLALIRVRAPAREASLAVQLFDGDSSLFYRDGRLNELLLMDGPGHLHVAARPAHGHPRKKDLFLKTYIYNHGLGPLAVERMEVWLRRANPYQYALFGPIGR